MSETWVLNSQLTFGAKSWSYNINFTCDEVSYSKFSYSFVNPLATYLVYDTTQVYEGNTGWFALAYQTITFDEPVTDETLLAWLQANGTKQ